MEKTLDIAGMLAEEERKHAPFRGTVKGYKDGPNGMRIIAEPPYCYSFANNGFFEYVGPWRASDLKKDTTARRLDPLSGREMVDMTATGGPAGGGQKAKLLARDGSMYIECAFEDGEIQGDGARLKKTLVPAGKRGHKSRLSALGAAQAAALTSSSPLGSPLARAPAAPVQPEVLEVTEVYRGQFYKGEANGEGLFEKGIVEDAENVKVVERYQAELARIKEWREGAPKEWANHHALGAAQLASAGTHQGLTLESYLTGQTAGGALAPSSKLYNLDGNASAARNDTPAPQAVRSGLGPATASNSNSLSVSGSGSAAGGGVGLAPFSEHLEMAAFGNQG